MPSSDFDILAPGLFDQEWNRAQSFGATVSLWMHSSAHRRMPLEALSRLLLPPMDHRQFALGSRNGKPLFYVAWARFDAAAETRYVRQHPLTMTHADWASGERLWITDFVAPFGHAQDAAHWVLRQAFAFRIVRVLYHRGEQRGLRIKHLRGRSMPAAEARAWLAANPVDLGSSGECG